MIIKRKRLSLIVSLVFGTMSLCTASTLIVVNKEAGNIPEKYMSNIATNSNGTSVGSIVDSLYDAAADEDSFIPITLHR